MTGFRSIPFLAAVVGICAQIGCSGESGAGRAAVYPVTGKVTLNGAPVANAFLSFSPKGKQPAATGRTDDQGVYKLTTYDFGDGAAAGDYEVLITKENAAPAQGPVGGHDPNARSSTPPQQHAGGRKAAASSAGSALPEKYGRHGDSKLEAKVTEGGKNTFDFDLKP